MRRLGGACLLLGLSAAASVGVAACSSDDSSDDEIGTGDEDGGGGPDVVDGAAFDRRPRKDVQNDVTDGGVDADADARRDADAADAKPDKSTSPPTGSPCGPVNKVEQRPCGICGVQFRVCLGPDDGEDASMTGPDAGSWVEWGECLNELDGGCVNGTTDAEACGMCGTRKWTCGKDCRWTVTDCRDAGVCWPGTLDFFGGLSCDGGKGRERACETTCQWAPFGACEAPTSSLEVPQIVGDYVSRNIKLVQDPDAGMVYPSWTCPAYSYNESPWYMYPQQYVELRNTGAQDVTVSVWTSYVDGGLIWPWLYVTTYPTKPEATDWPARLACVGAFNDWCGDMDAHGSACTGINGNWGGLMIHEGNGVTVPALSSVWIYVIDSNDNWWHTGTDLNNLMINVGVKREALDVDGGT